MTVILIILSFISALLEATILPAAKIAGGFFELGTVIIIIFSFWSRWRDAGIFLIFWAIFLAMLTKIPAVYFLLPNFIIMIGFFFLFSRRVIPRPTTLFSFPLFFVAVAFVDFIKILILAEFSLSGFSHLIADAFISALFATVVYYMINKIYFFFNPGVAKERVKLAE